MLNHPIEADATVIGFIDLQDGIINLAGTADRARLRTCIGALAELATIFSIPVAIACVPTTSGAVAPLVAEIAARFPDAPVNVRNSANAMDDSGFLGALESSGRRTLVIAGVATEVAVALAAIGAQRNGYNVVVAVDACSGIDERSESATFAQLSSLGVTLSSVLTLAAELAGDFNTENGRAAMRVLQSALGGHAHQAAATEHGHDGNHRHDHDGAHDV